MPKVVENMVNENKRISCGSCGVEFENEDAIEKHTLKIDGERWCGITALRIIEENRFIALIVNAAIKSKYRREAEAIRRRRGW